MSIAKHLQRIQQLVSRYSTAVVAGEVNIELEAIEKLYGQYIFDVDKPITKELPSVEERLKYLEEEVDILSKRIKSLCKIVDKHIWP